MLQISDKLNSLLTDKVFSYTTVRNRSQKTFFRNTNTYCVNAQFPTALGQSATCTTYFWEKP